MMYTAAITGRAFFIWQSNPLPFEAAFLPTKEFMWHVTNISPRSVCGWGEQYGGGEACEKQLEQLHVTDESTGKMVSPFEKRFGNVTEIVTDTNSVSDVGANRQKIQWELLIDKIPTDEPVVFVHTNEPLAKSRNGIRKLINHLRNHPLHAWTDNRLALEMENALLGMVDQDAIGCAMKLLFTPSPGLRSASEGLIRRSFNIQSQTDNTTVHTTVRTPPLLPFDYFFQIPLFQGLGGHKPAVTFTEHLEERAYELTTSSGRKVNKVIGMHLRIAPSADQERAFKDSIQPLMTLEEAELSVDCAQKLARALGWGDGVVLFVVSDSYPLRRSFPQKFGDLVATDPKPLIQHVDKVLGREEGDVIDGYLAAVADMFMLAHSDGLVLTRSNFGVAARAMGLVPREAGREFVRNNGKLECMSRLTI
eukprot:GHVS01045643.1.p1 GENE.GHVS01045643.1~~GHVS01045643.1.p1  ORF type:complete len:421 (+),score=46.89 GHVS01045643.1:2-1264(+)